MRKRYRQINGRLVEIDMNAPRPPRKTPYIMGDIEPYESPIDGAIISSRKERREDLLRSGCRPYEGFESEQREADKFRAEQDRQFDEKLGGMIEKTYYELRDGMTEPAQEIKPEWILGQD